MLEWYAHLAVPGHAEWGVRLFANASALRRALGEATPPLDKKEHDALVVAMHAAQDVETTRSLTALDLETGFDSMLREMIASVLAADMT